MASEAGGRAFPIVYVSDVLRAEAFYVQLGFRRAYQHPPEGEPGFVNLRLGDAELGLVHERSLADLLGRTRGDGPRFEVFVYVPDVDEAVERLRASVTVLREAEDMPWGERLAYVADPDGNPVALAATSG